MQGNVWKVGPNAKELIVGGPESRESFRQKMPKNGIFYSFFYIFLNLNFYFFNVFVNIFNNSFRIMMPSDQKVVLPRKNWRAGMYGWRV